MNFIFEFLSKSIARIAISTLDSYSWVGMYEPSKPKELLKYKK